MIKKRGQSGMPINIDDYPSWMRTGLAPCPVCGKPVLLFYDEQEQYRIRCSEGDFQYIFRINSMENAKRIWNESMEVLT